MVPLWLDEGQQVLLGDPAEVVQAFRDQTSLETRARTPDPALDDGNGMQSDLVLRDNRLGSQEVRISALQIQ